MGTKSVIASDDREWIVSRTMLTTMPAIGDEFEHDVDAGRSAVALILTALTLFWLIIIWMWFALDGLYIPGFYYWVFGGMLAFFPARYILRLPWKIVARTQGDYGPESNAENWVGTVRGVSNARQETKMIVRSLRARGNPGGADSPLQQVD